MGLACEIEGSMGTSELEFMLLLLAIGWAFDAPSGRDCDGLGCCAIVTIGPC